MNRELNPLKTQCKLGLYTVAAGALAAGNAFAVPTPSPNAPLSVFAPDNNSAWGDFDIDGNGVSDFTIFVSAQDSCSSGTAGYAYLSSNYGGLLASTDEDQYYAAMITPGQRIDDSLNFVNNFAYLLGCSSSDAANAQFADGEQGFVGLQFQRGGNTHFGYVEVEAVAGSLTVNILSACFESEPGTPVSAGRCFISPIPVNGVVVPLSLALLALGGMALRRRKQQA